MSSAGKCNAFEYIYLYLAIPASSCHGRLCCSALLCSGGLTWTSLLNTFYLSFSVGRSDAPLDLKIKASMISDMFSLVGEFGALLVINTGLMGGFREG